MLVVGLVEVKTLMLVVGSNSASSNSFYADLTLSDDKENKIGGGGKRGGGSKFGIRL